MKKITLFNLIRKLSLTAGFLLFLFNSFSQNAFRGIKFGGFIKSDYWYDSRVVVGSREDLFALYPQKPVFDKKGIDINNHPNFHFSAITSRINGKIIGPDIGKTASSGYIEADFSGNSNPDVGGLWLRQAWMKLKWEKSELLFGQTWHPMFTTDCFPTVVSLNTGAPFNPFIRSPQVSFTKYHNKFKLVISALSQRDYSNEGPMGRSTLYKRNALVPNLHAQLQYNTGNHLFGLAYDLKNLKPELYTDSLIKTNSLVGSSAVMGFYKFSKNKFELKSKIIFGQNMTEHLMLGGYAVSSYDSTTAKKTFTPSNNFSFWANLIYGKKIQSGIFCGFTRNLGTPDNNTGIFYGRGSDIDYVYRISPFLLFKVGNANFQSELEYTVVAYGTTEPSGKVNSSKETANFRLLFIVMYHF